MNDKEHPRYSKDELRQAYYIITSIAEEIEQGNMTDEEIKGANGLIGDKKEALEAIELVGHLLEVYGA